MCARPPRHGPSSGDPGLSTSSQGRISLSSETQVENAPRRPLSLPVRSQGRSSYYSGLGWVGLAEQGPSYPGTWGQECVPDSCLVTRRELAPQAEGLVTEDKISQEVCGRGGDRAGLGGQVEGCSLRWGMEGKRGPVGWGPWPHTCVFHLDQAGVERKSRFGAS